MSPNLFSNADFARLTSRVVAVCCETGALDAAHLPVLIASVNKALRREMAVLGKRAPRARPARPGLADNRRHLDRPQHTLRRAPIHNGRGKEHQQGRIAFSSSATNVVELNASAKGIQPPTP
jgi:hypothetical protein